MTNERPGPDHVIWGPMRSLAKNLFKLKTHGWIYGHRDLQTNWAQRAELVKINYKRNVLIEVKNLVFRDEKNLKKKNSHKMFKIF